MHPINGKTVAHPTNIEDVIEIIINSKCQEWKKNFNGSIFDSLKVDTLAKPQKEAEDCKLPFCDNYFCR